MQHICFHAISNYRSEYLGSQDEVKNIISKWKKLGESHIKVFKITTEEMDSDFINLNEKEIELSVINKN